MNTTAGPVKADLRMSGWGEPVSITAPAADQVRDMSSVVRGYIFKG